MALAVPPVGERVTFRKGALSLILENHHGGLCVLTPHPQHPRRHMLGLPRDGSLELAVRVPEHKVRVVLHDRLTLAPQGRLHGYLTVPLPHRLLWRRPNGGAEPLLEVTPKELQTSWLGEGENGGYVHETESSFHLERRGLEADTWALVPVVLCNHGDHTLSPETLTLSIRERDLREIDGQVITSPRRLHLRGEERVDEQIRAIPRRSA